MPQSMAFSVPVCIFLSTDMHNIFKILAIVAILVALVDAGYQFQDPDFNQLLYDDLTEVVDDETEPVRLKRNAATETDQLECKHKSSKKEKEAHCCNGDMSNKKELEAIKAVKKICIEESRGTSANEISFDPLSCEGVLAMRQQMSCAAECLAKKFGLLTENGEVNREAVLNHTRTIVGNIKWKVDVFEEYVDSCLYDLSVTQDLNKSEQIKDAVCNSRILDFHQCTWRKFVKGCPADLQIQSKKCKKVRARLANGNNSYSEKSYKTSSHKRSHKS